MTSQWFLWKFICQLLLQLLNDDSGSFVVLIMVATENNATHYRIQLTWTQLISTVRIPFTWPRSSPTNSCLKKRLKASHKYCSNPIHEDGFFKNVSHCPYLIEAWRENKMVDLKLRRNYAGTSSFFFLSYSLRWRKGYKVEEITVLKTREQFLASKREKKRENPSAV